MIYTPFVYYLIFWNSFQKLFNWNVCANYSQEDPFRPLKRTAKDALNHNNNNKHSHHLFDLAATLQK